MGFEVGVFFCDDKVSEILMGDWNKSIIFIWKIWTLQWVASKYSCNNVPKLFTLKWT